VETEVSEQIYDYAEGALLPMKDHFSIFAQYNREANKTILSILKGLSLEERNQDRGSYYKSLSGLAVHILGGSVFLLGMCKAAAAQNAAAAEALAPLEKISLPKGALTEAQWNQFEADLVTADNAYVNFIAALSDEDLKAPVKLDWYGGNPGSAPLFFMISQLVAHGTHHRGQISQILDSLKIDNDYSGINIAFLPK
jgi:uncharacterized damage-inducible protein DinB